MAFDFLNIFFLLLLFFFSFLTVSVFNGRNRSSNNVCHLPPSPPALPVIGHLHHLLSVPWFKSLQKLGSKYGPLLYLRVFNSPFIVVSSASFAYEIHRAQDSNFVSRDAPAIEKSLLFGAYGFVTAPYGSYWKFMKKLTVTELLGPQALEKSRCIRGEELERFRVRLSNKARKNEIVDVGMEMMKLTNNSICRMIMGTRCSEENGEAEQVRELVTKSFALTKKLLVAATVGRSVKKLGFTLFEKEIIDVSRRYDELFEKIITEHEQNPNRGNKDMMDIMLEACREDNAEFQITRNHIKSCFVDFFLGGTDTSAQTTPWIMAEIINNPRVLQTLRKEIESALGKPRVIQEIDLPKLPYLQAVVKEGLRLHPPAPILSRKTLKDCKVGGFDIRENTTIIINAYAIMRDPDSWENPEEFRPERFSVASSEGEEGVGKEHVLKYLPFGGGRRGCPGSNLGYIFMGTAVGTMVQCFDWKVNGEKVRIEEAGDMNLTMAHPLECTPLSRF
ncbi:PREDICTED: cytochrome P450 705A5-like [Tarenaya hassleriana]|uniref:cytochrome P450 705A5-like n=1 Tax=Tarenaya hassleriana TaxID=28532 RepID=UPI00053C0BB1|nr:PREDICTED: cytochrome P450 705A5-like [Tarenaya hassleriana]